MTKQHQRPTAKIYAFPARPRATAGGHRQHSKPTQQQAAAQLPTVEFGRGWYHEAAIEENEQAGDLNHQQH